MANDYYKPTPIRPHRISMWLQVNPIPFWPVSASWLTFLHSHVLGFTFKLSDPILAIFSLPSVSVLSFVQSDILGLTFNLSDTILAQFWPLFSISLNYLHSDTFGISFKICDTSLYSFWLLYVFRLTVLQFDILQAVWTNSARSLNQFWPHAVHKDKLWTFWPYFLSPLTLLTHSGPSVA